MSHGQALNRIERHVPRTYFYCQISSYVYDLDSSLKRGRSSFYPQSLEPIFNKLCSILSRFWLCFCKVRSTRFSSKWRASYSDLTSTLVLSNRLSTIMTVWEYTSPTEGNVILERGGFVRLRACIIPSGVLGFLSYYFSCHSCSIGLITQVIPSTLIL